MPIVMRHNHALELTRVDYVGKVLAEDLSAYAAYGAANQTWLAFDCICFVSADADVSAATPAHLDALFNAYGGVFAASPIARRSGWVCHSLANQQALNHWIDKRNANRGQSGEVRQFDSFEAASAWLLLDAEGAATLASGDGFVEIARFDASATPAR